MWALAEHWCTGLPANTARAYREAIRAWLLWCQAVRGIDSLRATFLDTEAYARHLHEAPSPRTGRPLSPTTIKARLSALASWYTRLSRLGLFDRASPFAPGTLDRPVVDPDHSDTVGLSEAEATALLRAARTDRGRQAKRTRALIAVLLTCGARVAEIAAADADQLTTDAGHRVLPLVGKGGKTRPVVLAPWVARDLEEYLDGRTTGPLFATTGGGRLDQGAIWHLIRRLARDAGLPAADRLSPHSLRHTAITLALDADASLRDVQDMAGHANPRTTRRYDRHRGRLDRSPTYRLAAALGPE